MEESEGLKLSSSHIDSDIILVLLINALSTKKDSLSCLYWSSKYIDNQILFG